MDNHDQLFWEDLLRSSERHESVVGERVPQELDDFLWALAEGRLPASDEMKLFELVSRYRVAHERLSEIQDAISRAKEVPRGDAETVWARLSTKSGQTKTRAKNFMDLAIEWLDSGLRLLESTGQDAYAPLLARDQEKNPYSISQLYLTAAGTLRVTVDRSLEPSKQPFMSMHLEWVHRVDTNPTDVRLVKLVDADTEVLHESKIEEQPVSFANLESGTYVLLIVEGTSKSELRIELR